MLHAGHILMLEEAKKQCDHLIVGLHSDPSIDRSEKNKPVQSVEERKIVLRGIKWVDEIRVYDTEEELYNMLIIISPEVRILGIDWKGKEYTGHDIGLRVHFNSRGHSWSTRELRKRVYNAERSKDDFR